jgi:hypothetical protein
MPIKTSRAGPSVALGIVGLALIAGVLLIRQTPHAPGVGSDPLPPDIVALGVVVTPATPDGKISAEQAIGVAEKEFADIANANVESYLVELTDPTQLGGLKDRAIWIIKASGVSLPVYGTFLGARPSDEATAGTVLYIYVDALTGEWLLAHN